MKTYAKVLFFLLVKGLILAALSADPPEFYKSRCSSGNYTVGSTYQSNLRSVLKAISANTNITYGFYNFSSGQSSDTVYAIAMCTGYTTLEQCRSCVSNATARIVLDCPNQMEASGWYIECMIRYSNNTIFGVLQNDVLYFISNHREYSNPSVFNFTLQTVLNTVKGDASSGNSLRKYASGNFTSSFETVYAIAQCTPDLSMSQCTSCLDKLERWIPSCCNDRVGARLFSDSCFFRYEEYKFFTDTPTLEAPSLATAPSPSPLANSPLHPDNVKKTKNSHVVIIVAAAASAAVIVLIVCLCVVRKLRRQPEEADEIGNSEILHLRFETIRAATDDFSDANMLGRGGFGAVYKCLLPDGREVAAKRLSADSVQGDLEFKNEVLLVAKLQHRNLIRLLGFCLEKEERILVYEYTPNASLDRFLFDPIKRSRLTWELRRKIIEGIARGLQYLHEDSRLKIIHRDLKASNVLLDEDMNPKIADFGMARLFVMDQSRAVTHRIVGTFGYMAPEYAMHGHFSVKSDVFSFGVLVLEIVSGQRNVYQKDGKAMNLLSNVWRRWREGSWVEVVDPGLRDECGEEVIRWIHIGLLCVQQDEESRPTMASVVMMLSSQSLSLSAPSRPAFLMNRGDEVVLLSLNEVSISEVSPR